MINIHGGRTLVFSPEIPRSNYYDAAKIDGAGDFTFYTRIIVGMMKPVISVLSIFTFRAVLNDY